MGRDEEKRKNDKELEANHGGEVEQVNELKFWRASLN
jgi:hypothetical protein